MYRGYFGQGGLSYADEPYGKRTNVGPGVPSAPIYRPGTGQRIPLKEGYPAWQKFGMQGMRYMEPYVLELIDKEIKRLQQDKK